MQERTLRLLPLGKVCAALAGVLVLAVGSARGQTGSESSVGYIDSAVVGNQFRLRYDHAFDDDRPYRASFFYAKPGELGGPSNIISQEKASYQDVSAYAEMAVTERLSGFVEVPVRFLDTVPSGKTAGLTDMNFGFKYALLQEPDRLTTFQLRTYLPTGAASHDLGTDHVSLEPALLYLHRYNEAVTVEAELRDYIPVGAGPWAGNIVRYGVGVSYTMAREKLRIIPVVEVVGWTVLGGKDFISDSDHIFSAGGDTIVNAKFGLRLGLGQANAPGALSKTDLYVGYGRALTDQVWYKNIFSAEVRFRF
jgi:hypothetical protein